METHSTIRQIDVKRLMPHKELPRPKLLGVIEKQVLGFRRLAIVGYLGCMMMRVKCYIVNLLRDDAIGDLEGTIRHRRDKAALIRVSKTRLLEPKSTGNLLSTI